MSKGVRWLLVCVLAWCYAHSPGHAHNAGEVTEPMHKRIWATVDSLIEAQRFQEALDQVVAIRDKARGSGDVSTWTEALVKETQLRLALHGYETAVKELKSQEWPQDPMASAVLNLFYAHALMSYLDAYSWEIDEREKVETTGAVDLGAWTRQQIFHEAVAAFAKVWARRETLGSKPVKEWEKYLVPNTYPPHIRGTLRDAVTYLFVELLAHTGNWTPKEANEVYALDLALLLAGAPLPEDLSSAEVHPLEKISALLADLETWHRTGGRLEAALEARLELCRRMWSAFTHQEDRRTIRDSLAGYLGPLREMPWWAEGMAQLAEFVREEDSPDALQRARALALEGAEAFPQSVGGQHCLSIVRGIERPDYSVQIMTVDGVGKRSLRVTHKNVSRLSFIAFRLDWHEWVRTRTDSPSTPPWGLLRELVEGKHPSLARVSWEVDLPPTPDFRHHHTYVVPPLTTPGFYLIVSSARRDFSPQDNELYVVPFFASDLVIVRSWEDETLSVRVLSGSTGAPVEGAQVGLWQRSWRDLHREVASALTDREGVARFTRPRAVDSSFFVVARKGEHLSVDEGYLTFPSPSPERTRTAALVFTDRSVYRPHQKVWWKVVVYRAEPGEGRFVVAPRTSAEVWLRDPNGERVASTSVVTNEFGTASGEFVIPGGRLLGEWTIACEPSGSQVIRVEEYKRPTFEVSLRDPEEPLRLNRAATLRGEARYYFGLPVSSGKVTWRVTRQPVYPRWMWWRAQQFSAQTVATGTTTLDEAGTFSIQFTPKADERLAQEAQGITYRFQVSAEVTDEGGETRSTSRVFRVGFVAVDALISLAAPFVVEGEVVEVQIGRTNLDGVGRPGEGTWELFSLALPPAPLLPADEPVEDPPKPGQYQTPGDSLTPRWDRTFTPERAMRRWEASWRRSHGRVVHDAHGLATVRLAELPAGAYRLVYRTQDEFGASLEVSRELVVVGEKPNLPLPLVMWVDRTSGYVGEKVRVFVWSGLPGQPIFLEFSKGGTTWQRRVVVAGRDPALLELALTPEERGGFGVSAYTVADHQVITSTASVWVPWENKTLNLSFSRFRDTMRPGSPQTWSVTVKRWDDTPVEAGAAEVLAYMYDKSLEVFAPHVPPSIPSLYPSRARPQVPRINLGFVVGTSWDYASFAPSPGYPAPTPDYLATLSSYGIGGPGRRFRGAYLQAEPEAVVFMRAVPPPTPQPRPTPLEEAPREDQVSEAKEKAPQTPLETPEPQPELRAKFHETAFWEPHLLTGPDGSVTLEFTVPEAVTAWRVWVHAVTKDLAGGSLAAETQTIKELMVRPYLPRFLREGDEASLRVVVNNASAETLRGHVTVDITDPQTGQSLLESFGLPASGVRLPFTVEPSGGATVTFPVKVPPRVGTVAFRVVATSGQTSDGELRPLPVLPGRMHLVQSRFVTLRDADRKVITFEDLARGDDPTLRNDQLVVTLDAQLFLTVLQALPYLVNFPYECTEQTLNRFLSTGIVSSLYAQYPAIQRLAREFSSRRTRFERFDEPDPNRVMLLEETPWLREARGGDESEELINVLDDRVARGCRDDALEKLRKAQLPNGAFPWWPGGPPSPYMTLYLLHGFSKALEFGVEVPKDMVQRAWGYVGRYYKEELMALMAKDCCFELLTLVNYVASCYPDPSWTGDALTPEDREKILQFCFSHWRQHSPYLKGYLALTLHRMGRTRDALLVWGSVMDSAKFSDELGTYWAPEDRSWLWYNDTIETHAFALRTLMELDPQNAHRHGLVQWLLLNKKLNQWKSTKATAEVIYSLVHYLKAEGTLLVPEDATVTVGNRKTTFSFDPDRYTGRHNQVVIPGPQVGPSTATVVVEKTSKGLAFASATWHFSTERLPEAERGDFFQVSRRYYKRESTPQGFVLKPLTEGTPLAVGDQIEVHLSLRAHHQAEYVHLRDPRPAGTEPESQVSRFKWDLGIGWYEEVRDSGTNFFFEYLPFGEYTFRYRLRAATAGVFRVAPATVQSMYAPEFNAYSAGAVVLINP